MSSCPGPQKCPEQACQGAQLPALKVTQEWWLKVKPEESLSEIQPCPCTAVWPGQGPHHSEPQFLHLYNGDNKKKQEMVGEINKIMVCKPVKHWTWWKWESLWPFFKKKKKCFWEFVVGQIWEAKSLENWEWLWDNIPRWCSGKKSTCYCRRHKRHRFNSWVGKIPWRRKWQPVFLLGEFHGQRSLADDGPWGCKGSDTTFKAEVRSL